MVSSGADSTATFGGSSSGASAASIEVVAAPHRTAPLMNGAPTAMGAPGYGAARRSASQPLTRGRLSAPFQALLPPQNVRADGAVRTDGGEKRNPSGRDTGEPGLSGAVPRGEAQQGLSGAAAGGPGLPALRLASPAADTHTHNITQRPDSKGIQIPSANGGPGASGRGCQAGQRKGRKSRRGRELVEESCAKSFR